MSDTFAGRFLAVLEATARANGDMNAGAGMKLARRFGIGRFVKFRTVESPDGSAPDAERVLLGIAHGFLMEAAHELSHALTSRCVPHFFVKGIALANRFYEPGEREMADIDLHVAPDTVAAALETLNSLGYEIPPDAEQSGPPALRSGVFAGRYAGSTFLEHIGLDVAWGLDPVDRFLPRPDCFVPEEVWDNLESAGGLPVPKDSHHVVLLIHHLVHHDMLHFRGLVDLALLWPKIPEVAGAEVESLAAKVGVLRATRLLGAVLESDLGVRVFPSGPTPAEWRGRRARAMLELAEWCRWASSASKAEFVEINVRRIRRRLLLLDRLRDAPGLFADAVFPPRVYLRWRWPECATAVGAWWHHVKRVAAKLV